MLTRNLHYGLHVLLFSLSVVAVLSSAQANLRSRELNLGSGLHSSESRKAQSTLRQDQSGSMAKCYDLLRTSFPNQDSISMDNYLAFLRNLSDGMIDYIVFSEIPLVYSVIFYTAACSGEQDCINRQPELMILPTNPKAQMNLDFFCKSILTFTDTHVTFPFDYSIQYDTSVITEDSLRRCLSSTTQKLLMNHIAGCEGNPRANSTPSGNGSAPCKGNRFLAKEFDQRLPALKPVFERFFATDEIEKTRTLLVRAPHCSESSQCPYEVHANVTQILDLPCDPSTSPNMRCGIVRASTAIAVNQYMEPSASLLRETMADLLRRAINGPKFRSQLTMDCLLGL